MDMEIIEIHKSFRKKSVLNGLSIAAAKGSCIGILGGNGCGKSTFLSVLAGVQKPEQGQFIWQGQDLLTNHKLREGVVGYVPQEASLIEELNAWDNLRMWYESEKIRESLHNGVLAKLNISDFLKVPVQKMSGGMKKRLSIACAVMDNPQILLLDEPTAALDLACKEQIYNYIKSYRENGGIVLLTTHELTELDLCTECYIMKQGKLSPYQYDGDLKRLVGLL